MDIQKSTKLKEITCGQDIAKYLIYFSRMLDRRFFEKEINIVNISGITLYKKHKKIFDYAASLQKKYGIDMISYIKFFVSKYKFNDSNLDHICDVSNIVWYANDLEIKAKHNRVYKYVQKTADNIVEECLKHGFDSASKYLKYLIENNTLASKYLSGEISQYYLAGIQNLKKIVRNMDEMSRVTLNEVVENQDKIASDMQDAFVYLKSKRISIIQLTDNLLSLKMMASNKK